MKFIKVLSLLTLSLFAAVSLAQNISHQKVSSGEITELNKAFAKLLKSDGYAAEELSIAIGKSIASNPINFLKAYSKNKRSVDRIDALVGNLGPDFVDDFPRQADEIKKRIKALEEVKDPSLKALATECIEQLKKQLKVVDQAPS